MKYMLVSVCLTLMSTSVWAQTGNIRGVIEYRIKPERATEFVDLQKQFATELKKIGASRDRYIFQLMSGPRAYIAVTYYGKWADLDTPLPSSPTLAALLARINSCVESSERQFHIIDAELSIRESSAMPNFVQALRLSVKPDKVNEYLALAKSTSLPGYKKAGIKRRTFARVRYGGSTSMFVSSVGVDKWSDLDKPPALQAGLGDAGYAAFSTKLQTLVNEIRADVYRYLPEASYVVASGASGGR